MTPENILEVANRPDVPKFVFGSQALAEWNRAHRNMYTHQAMENSGPYVVIHQSLIPGLPDFRVLSQWNIGDCVPRSRDVPVTS